MTQNVNKPCGPTKHRIGRSVCIAPACGYDVGKIGAGCLVLFLFLMFFVNLLFLVTCSRLCCCCFCVHVNIIYCVLSLQINHYIKLTPITADKECAFRFRVWHCDGRQLASSPATSDALFDVCWQPRPDSFYPSPTVSPATVATSQQEGNEWLIVCYQGRVMSACAYLRHNGLMYLLT